MADQVDNRVPDFDLIAARLFEEVKRNKGSKTYVVTVSVQETESIVVEKQGSFATIGFDENGKDIKGYAPSRPEIESRKTDKTIFSQTIYDLDVSAVVRAVNGISVSGL